MVTAGLKGLNPQVQVEPLSLSITSFPPILVEFAVPAAGDAVPDVFDELPDDVFDELPPHAVTSIATAVSAMRQLTRFTVKPSVPRPAGNGCVKPIRSAPCGRPYDAVGMKLAVIGAGSTYTPELV